MELCLEDGIDDGERAEKMHIILSLLTTGASGAKVQMRMRIQRECFRRRF